MKFDNLYTKIVSEAPDSGADHHNEYMMNQELLQPLHAAAVKAGAKDLNDWIIKQIKDQGENWVDWFISTVLIGDEYDEDEDYDDEETGRIPHDVDSFKSDDD